MKYAAYNEYKTSGSNWLGAVPSHWNVKPLKLIVKMPITDGPHETPEFIPDGVPFASVEAIWDGKVHLSSVRGYISEDDHRRYGKKYHPKKGDIFIVKSGSTTGKIAIVDFDDDFNVWSPLAAVRCDASQAHPEFVFYALSSSYFQRLVQVSWSFGTQPNIGMGVLGNLPAVLPPLIEQQTIARFLDAKTAQIDALVAQKRQLIEKLKEKRSALIARTVTRGLPPEAAKAAGLEPHPEMKDSGVDWLGQIPVHWTAKAVRYIFKNCDSRRIPLSSEERADLEKLYPYYGASGIIDMVDDYLFDEPLVLVAEDGANLLSRSTPLAFLATGKYWVNNHAHILKPLAGDIRYWVATLESFDFLPLITGAAQPKLTADRLGGIRLPVPPATEQAAIADYLAAKTEELDALVGQAVEVIYHLTEYRQALITSAVTGKIDVRAVASLEMEMT